MQVRKNGERAILAPNQRLFRFRLIGLFGFMGFIGLSGLFGLAGLLGLRGFAGFNRLFGFAGLLGLRAHSSRLRRSAAACMASSLAATAALFPAEFESIPERIGRGLELIFAVGLESPEKRYRRNLTTIINATKATARRMTNVMS
jgi:hypothetical protein